MKWIDDKLMWGRTRIRYQYGYSDRKTLAISVYPNLDIRVTAPIGAKLIDIQAKVLKKASWICQAKRDFELYLPKQPSRQYIAGETHRYLGRQYRLKIVHDETVNSVKCYRGCLWVGCAKTTSSPKDIQKSLQCWYREKAKKLLLDAILKYSPRVLMREDAIPLFTIREMKTRWGSCSKSGRIIFNLELIKAPVDCIEYVVVHELCHLREHNHGARFWKMVERVLPDYLERKNRLNKFADI